ncbi:unnamed protein product [Staurois parvus]|uniref:Ig-like domain-containing protein n=1 Tax=Staurois parvus TaxID=386267 RepID=A0ABN9D6R3_9NEOB|nr:unnamed protein product [Staurois parvus]
MEYSHLYFAEAPVIQTFRRNITSLNRDSILAIVGDNLVTRPGLNVTLDCPVKGLPNPKLTWMRKDHSLPNNSFVLLNGSLLLTNISSENEGTYILHCNKYAWKNSSNDCSALIWS